VAGGNEAVDELRGHALACVHDGALELRHPLLRSLLLARTWGDERRSVHAALAAALPAGAEQTRHRALAANGPDQDLADELEQLAARAGGRAGNAWALERSAELTPVGARRALRLLAAARASFDIRDMVAARRLAARVREEGEPTARAGLDELDARLALADGARLEGARALCAVAVEISETEAERAVRLFVTAGYVLATWGEAVEALDVVRCAQALGTSDPVLDLLIASTYAEAIGAAGEFVRAQQLFRELAEAGDRQATVHADRDARVVLVEALWSGGLFERARQVAVAAKRDARADGSLGELQLALACLFSIELATARLDRADEAAAEELELAAGLGRTTERREALGHLAWGDAFKGRAEDCRAHVRERLLLSEEAGLSTTPHPALGLLELGLGNFDAAAAALGPSEEGYARGGRSAAASIRPCMVDLSRGAFARGRPRPRGCDARRLRARREANRPSARARASASRAWPACRRRRLCRGVRAVARARPRRTEPLRACAHTTLLR
jgi:hypothetical protein